MRFFCILLALSLLPVHLHAQTSPSAGGASGGTILGTVVAAETMQPLGSVSVTVRTAADSTVVASELSGASGQFRVTGLPTGRYLVEASLLGFEPFTRAGVEITSASPVVDLGQVRLASAAIAIDAVEVEAERPTVITAPDRTIYRTEDMPVAAGGAATDVLHTVPELEVDIEGSVSLNGAAPQIYINGRPAPVDGEALAVFLQQFPADRIERIEVIANPSARFEAEGAGGIVNIVLKEDVDLGLSGNLFMNAGTRGDLGSGGRVAYQRGPWTLSGGGFLRYTDRSSTSYDLRQNLRSTPITFLEQDAWSDREGVSANVDMTAEWRPNERTTLWSQTRVFRNGFDADGVTVYTRMDEGRAITTRYDRSLLDQSGRLTTDARAGINFTFEPRRHDLELELRYRSTSSDRENRVRERVLGLDGFPLGTPAELTLDMTDERQHDLRLNLDYTRPWGETGQFEVGYRARLRETDNDRVLQSLLDDDPATPIASELRGYGFRQLFHSGYLTTVQSLGQLRMQLGVRGEHVDTRLEVPGTTDIYERTLPGLFPSANLVYDLGDGRRVRASYSQRVRRPNPRVLNPIDRSNDPMNRQVGNPELDPQYTHSFNLEGSWAGSFGTLRLAPYFRRTVDDWTQVRQVDADGVSTVTWLNLATTDRYGTSLTGSLRSVRGISGFASVSGFREVRDASNLATGFSGSSMRWSARGNVNGRLTPTLVVQGTVSYSPAREVLQGRISSSVMTSLGVRQRLMDGRASLNLMTTDPFDLYRSSFETRDPSHVQIGSSRQSLRRAVLSFSYSFGRSPRDSQRQQAGDEDDEVMEPGIR